MNDMVNKDPGDDAGLPGMLRNTFKKMMMAVDGMLPAVVVSYDRRKNRAVVRPLISLLTTSGAVVPRAPLASIPVLALGGGGFLINFPLKPGDTGWIEASDRDVSLYMQSNKESQPNSQRLHSFSDGRFIPDVMGKYTIGGDTDAAMVIQNTAGTVCVSLHAGKAKIKAPIVEIEGVTNITGATTVTGGLTIDGIKFNTHAHGAVRSGSEVSGGVVK